MTLTQVLVERATFQAVASMAVPTLVIHSSVDAAKKVCQRMGRFQKWGPSVVGLSIIPLLPLYLDEPVEHAIGRCICMYVCMYVCIYACMNIVWMAISLCMNIVSTKQMLIANNHEYY